MDVEANILSALLMMDNARWRAKEPEMFARVDALKAQPGWQPNWTRSQTRTAKSLRLRTMRKKREQNKGSR